MFVVFDLDGTLADVSHRKHFILGTKKDWESFNAACLDDKPIPETIAVLRSLFFGPQQPSIEIWTGRDEKYRCQTEHWLIKNIGNFAMQIPVRMRPTKSRVQDDKLKLAWGEEFGMPDLVFEDRQRVVDMWRMHDVRVCQVAPGNF